MHTRVSRTKRSRVTNGHEHRPCRSGRVPALVDGGAPAQPVRASEAPFAHIVPTQRLAWYQELANNSKNIHQRLAWYQELAHNSKRVHQTNLRQDSPERAERSETSVKGLPEPIKCGVERLSGFSLSDVRVHYDSEKPAQLDALAYTQGTEIHLGRGQDRHLPHEAWHVVQQKQGRVRSTSHVAGLPVNDDDALEREADQMALRATVDEDTLSRQVPACGAASQVQRRSASQTTPPLQLARRRNRRSKRHRRQVRRNRQVPVERFEDSYKDDCDLAGPDSDSLEELHDDPRRYLYRAQPKEITLWDHIRPQLRAHQRSVRERARLQPDRKRMYDEINARLSYARYALKSYARYAENKQHPWCDSQQSELESAMGQLIRLYKRIDRYGLGPTTPEFCDAWILKCEVVAKTRALNRAYADWRQHEETDWSYKPQPKLQPSTSRELATESASRVTITYEPERLRQYVEGSDFIRGTIENIRAVGKGGKIGTPQRWKINGHKVKHQHVQGRTAVAFRWENDRTLHIAAWGTKANSAKGGSGGYRWETKP